MGKSVHNEETRKLMEGILKLQSVEECYAFFEDGISLYLAEWKN